MCAETSTHRLDTVEDLTGTTVGRFAILARLGAGGMGQVYLAEDPKLKRPVALKRMAPRLRADPHYRERFLKEAERASGFADAHVAAIHDILEENGELFLVMEYVEGSTLRDRLPGPMEVKPFLGMAIQCAQGLAAAHDKGIVHHDIKPENVMLTSSGDVKILDFGVAKHFSVPQEDTPTASVLTSTAAISGTPAYMAPEVLLEKPFDGRADIFSLGVVFYECLTGRHPFLAGGFMATSSKIIHEPAPRASAANPQVPAVLDGIIEKALEKDPDDRYVTARQLVSDLQRVEALHEFPRRSSLARILSRLRFSQATLAICAVVIAIVAAGVLVFQPKVRWKVERWLHIGLFPSERQLAVLPCRVPGGDMEAIAFANGLTETLTAKLTELTRGHKLQVVPASEVRRRGVATPTQAREEFGINLALEMTLQRAGSRLRITYVIVDAQELRDLRGDTITAASLDPFQAQELVGESVLAALEIELAPQEKGEFLAHGTRTAAAYDYYLQGRGYLQDPFAAEKVESAIEVFQRALELDSAYADAYAGLGEAYWFKYQLKKDSQLVGQSKGACEKAVALQPGEAGGHECLGGVYRGTGQYDRAAEEFQRAIDIEPTSDRAHRGLAHSYERLGKFRDAEETYLRAIKLRPDYWESYNWLGTFYLTHARYEDAANMFQEVVRRVPASFAGYSNLCFTYSLQARYSESMAMCQKSISIRPTAPPYSNLGLTYFYLRQFADSARAFEQAAKLDSRDYMVWGNLGDAYTWAPGERAKAKPAYRKAIELADERLQINPRDARTWAYQAWYHASVGDKRAAMERIERALRLSPHDPELMFNSALIHNQFAETEKALEWLDKSLRAGWPASSVRDTPSFDQLSKDPRLQKLLAKR